MTDFGFEIPVKHSVGVPGGELGVRPRKHHRFGQRRKKWATNPNKAQQSESSGNPGERVREGAAGRRASPCLGRVRTPPPGHAGL